jgi:predicted nucleic acid-binding protein
LKSWGQPDGNSEKVLFYPAVVSELLKVRCERSLFAHAVYLCTALHLRFTVFYLLRPVTAIGYEQHARAIQTGHRLITSDDFIAGMMKTAGDAGQRVYGYASTYGIVHTYEF